MARVHKYQVGTRIFHVCPSFVLHTSAETGELKLKSIHFNSSSRLLSSHVTLNILAQCTDEAIHLSFI